MSAVVTLSGPVYGNFILERDESLVIGRSLQAELSVDDLRVSRRHCRVVHEERGLVVQDLESANGTFLNGKRIQRAILRDNDLLQVGNAELGVNVDYSDEDYLERAYNCDTCGRAISLMTFADGEVIQLEDRFICPQCRAKEDTPEFSLVELEVVQKLYTEGFEVLEKLAFSGAVPIYKARKRSLDQLVALKALPLQGYIDQKKTTRFVQEAKTQARLRHKNIVAIYDVRQSQELIYIVMELVEGETLERMIERSGSRLAPREALRIGYQLARALEHAHAKGIIHRDVKPSNVMITPDGDAKLIDFGLAKNLNDLGLGITASGETLGTVGYMAPEQLRTARDVDERTDIFGLGASIYHALAGHPPFRATTEAELVQQMERGPSLDSLVGAPLNAVQLIMRMMQTRPEKRFQSPEELLRGMESVVGEITGIEADATNVEFLLKMRDDESDSLLQTWKQSRSSRNSAFLGSFQEGELVEFLGMLEFNQKSGTLQVASGDVRGSMVVVEGRIVRADTGRERDTAAIHRLLGLPRGDFEFSPGVVPPGRECDVPISQVVLDVLRHQDEVRANPGLKS